MSVDHRHFLLGAFEAKARENHFADPLEGVICNEFIAICHDFDLTQIQDSWSWRNTHTARELALLLIDDKGEIKRDSLIRAIALLEKNMYSLGPGREHDGSRQRHLLQILKHFYQNKEYSQALKRIYRPTMHPWAEKLIRQTLFLPEKISITDAHARQATLAALLTYLRQNVGSCFATAPAILIQQEQPLKFLADIGQLLATGRLTRTFEGIEYVVPLSASWGVGDLFRPFSLSSLGSNPLKTLAFSPGLQAAFEGALLIESHLSREVKREACEKLLRDGGIMENEADPYSPITPDRILKRVLLNSFKIKEKDITNLRETVIRGPLTELVIQAPELRGGKSLLAGRFLKAYESAKGAFKALTDNALLKAWEFTLASLSESKADFAKWNLYASLGVDPKDPFGIGESLYQVIQKKIEEVNVGIEALQSNYDHLFAQAKYLEGRISRASTDRELGWMQAEYQMRRHEINRALSERDAIYEKGRKLQGIYALFIDFMGKKIIDYFQEVYDAEMHDISANPYDDSPAGFRLLYKHGRSNTALWTPINSAGEYIQCLTSFFIAIETELNQLTEVEGVQKEVGELITTAILTIKRPDFLESSIYRLARAYHEPVIENPLQHLDEVKRKPWVYISGGTMANLVSCYWGSGQKPQEVKRWVESENELLAFLIDTVKELDFKVQKKYQTNPNQSMLAFAPTHAFLCKPGWKLFQEGWESDIYTYTWIRDHWMAPRSKFLDSILLDSRMMERMIQELLHFIPVGYRPIVKKALNNFTYSMPTDEFREKVLTILSYEKWLDESGRLYLVAEELDSILYRSLPLFPDHQLQERLEMIFFSINELESQVKPTLLNHIEKAQESVGKYQMLTAHDLRNIAKGVLLSAMPSTRSPIFYHQKITEAMQKLALSYPEPLLFADTNWIKNVFGFTLNPGTADLELWRFDECGSEGRPILIWQNYLNGTESAEWGLYSNPFQYGF